jgi:hypothetical protein
MDLLALLGTAFADVESSLKSKGAFKLFDDVTAGEWNEQFVQAEDSQWEFMLTEAGAIKTIFLYPENGCELPLGLRLGMPPRKTRQMFGEPTKSGEERVSKFLGPKGAWDRWDYPTYCLHVSYSRGTWELAAVTLMLPENAP